MLFTELSNSANDLKARIGKSITDANDNLAHERALLASADEKAKKAHMKAAKKASGEPEPGDNTTMSAGGETPNVRNMSHSTAVVFARNYPDIPKISFAEELADKVIGKPYTKPSREALDAAELELKNLQSLSW